MRQFSRVIHFGVYSLAKIFLLFVCVTSPFANAAERVEWYAAHKTLNEAGSSLQLNESIQKIDLQGGWSCSVGTTSKQLPAYESRQVTCQSDDKNFGFSVQCEPSRKKDHTQIRFNDFEGKFLDFFEVGCELLE